MSASHQRSLDSITAVQLLPIAATIVAAGTGSEMAQVMIPHSPQLALGTIIASYVMWGMGVPLAISVLVIYYQRLALHKMPPREVIVSCFLPLGPLGFGGYTILYLGKVSNEVFPMTDTIDPLAGRIAYIIGFFVALVMWGYGLIWGALALASIYKARPFPFNMGWWGCESFQISQQMPRLLTESSSHLSTRRLLSQHDPHRRRTAVFILSSLRNHLRNGCHPPMDRHLPRHYERCHDRQILPRSLSGESQTRAAGLGTS